MTCPSFRDLGKSRDRSSTSLVLLHAGDGVDVSYRQGAVVSAFAGDRLPADRASRMVARAEPCMRCTTSSAVVDGDHVIATTRMTYRQSTRPASAIGTIEASP
jgi:hypothetical protein